MISKERLNELLKTNNTIYAYQNGQCYDLILNKTMFIRENKLVELVQYGELYKEVEWDLENLFESEDVAEFICSIRRSKRSFAVCSACGSPVEYDDGDEFAYCPMCENDQVEITKRKDKAK